MRRIAIIGAECSGKTTLVRVLAAHFGAVGVEEYARDYVAGLRRAYDYHDVVKIALEQIRALENIRGLTFYDTDLVVTKVWFEDKWKVCPCFVTDYLLAHPVDMYILCLPDIAFEPDGVRENGHRRWELYTRYLEEVRCLGVPYAIVGGLGNARVECAICAIEKFVVNLPAE